LRARRHLHRRGSGARGGAGGLMATSSRSVHPPNDFPGYGSTPLRAPKQPLRVLTGRLSRLTAPLLAGETIGPLAPDLTRQHDGEPLGERISISGRVLD